MSSRSSDRFVEALLAAGHCAVQGVRVGAPAGAVCGYVRVTARAGGAAAA